MTEDYLRMCDCPEIQGQWIPKVGNRITTGSNRTGSSFVLLPIHMRPTGIPLVEEYVWLPRQEDIQEMFVERGRNCMPRLIESLCALTNYGKLDYGKPTNSTDMDKYWLKSYMREIHHKTWTEKGWA